MNLLRRRGIPHVTYPRGGFKKDLKDLNAPKPEIKRNVAESRARGLK